MQRNSGDNNKSRNTLNPKTGGGALFKTNVTISKGLASGGRTNNDHPKNMSSFALLGASGGTLKPKVQQNGYLAEVKRGSVN
jgi:hypothetical protein